MSTSTHEDSDGTGYCRGCGTTIGEEHHANCDVLEAKSSGASDSTQLLACKCGEEKYICFKHVYAGPRDNVWIVECQSCYRAVPVVSYMYDPERFTNKWNAKQANKI